MRRNDRRASEEGSTTNLTAEQARAIRDGRVITVTVGGAPCVVLRKDVYERGGPVDYSPWSSEEMDLLASETADLLAGDGLDEPEGR